MTLAIIFLLFAFLLAFENSIRASQLKSWLSAACFVLALLAFTVLDPLLELSTSVAQKLGRTLLDASRNITIKIEVLQQPKKVEPNPKTKNQDQAIARVSPSKGWVGLHQRQTWLKEKPRLTGLPRFTTVYDRAKQLPNYEALSVQNSEIIAVFTAMELGQWNVAAQWIDRIIQRIENPDRHQKRMLAHMVELRGIARLEQGYTALATGDFETAIDLLEMNMADHQALDHAQINLAIAKALLGKSMRFEPGLYRRMIANAGKHQQELSFYFFARSLQDELEGAISSSMLAANESLKYQQLLADSDPIAANRLASVFAQETTSLRTAQKLNPQNNAQITEAKPQKPKIPTPNQVVENQAAPRFTSVYPRYRQMPHYEEFAKHIPEVVVAVDGLEFGQWKTAEMQTYAALQKIKTLPPVRRALFQAQMEELLAIAKLERGSLIPAIAHFEEARSKMMKAPVDHAILDRLNLNLALAKAAAGQDFDLSQEAYTRLITPGQTNLQELALYFHARSLLEHRKGGNKKALISHETAIRYVERLGSGDPSAAKRLTFIKQFDFSSVEVSKVVLKTAANISSVNALSPPSTIAYPIETILAEFDVLKSQNYRFKILQIRWDENDWIGVRDFTVELEDWIHRYPFRFSLLARDGKIAKASLLHMRAVALMNIGEIGNAMVLLSTAKDILSAEEELSIEEIRVRLDLALIYLASSTPSTTVTTAFETKLLLSEAKHPLELALYYRYQALLVLYKDKKLAATYLASAKRYVPLLAKVNVARAKQLATLLEQNEKALHP